MLDHFCLMAILRQFRHALAESRNDHRSIKAKKKPKIGKHTSKKVKNITRMIPDQAIPTEVVFLFISAYVNHRLGVKIRF